MGFFVFIKWDCYRKPVESLHWKCYCVLNLERLRSGFAKLWIMIQMEILKPMNRKFCQPSDRLTIQQLNLETLSVGNPDSVRRCAPNQLGKLVAAMVGPAVAF